MLGFIQLLAVLQLQIISPMHQSRLEPPHEKRQSLDRISVDAKSQQLSRNGILYSTYGSILDYVISVRETPQSVCLCTAQDVEPLAHTTYEVPCSTIYLPSPPYDRSPPLAFPAAGRWWAFSTSPAALTRCR
jgi:hypothetical protein